MAPINWTGMTPEDVFTSLAAAPKVAKWEGLDVAFDPFGHQVAAVVGPRAVINTIDDRMSPRSGFYVSHEVAEAQLRADGYAIVNPATPEMVAEFERQAPSTR